MAADPRTAERYQFNPFSHSVRLGALRDFGCGDAEELPAAAPGDLFRQALGGDWACAVEHSWVRKKFPPGGAPSPHYRAQSWHQDGALGVHFPPEPGPEIPMTALVTCWIPLNPCGLDSPGLEFIRAPLKALLHFTELEDGALRRRFPAEAFRAPELAPGDALVFRNSSLHRTYARPEMHLDRTSVEYRIFPR